MDYKNEYHSDDDFDCSNGYGDNFNCNNNSNSSTNNNNNNDNNGNNSNSSMHHSNGNGMSKAELRKTNKPIMEKRRRARINHCLNELKSLILEAMKKDPARHTKLEKADILEMTVKHLQAVQRRQLHMAIQTDPTVIHKFKIGFTECAEEVSRFISQLNGIDPAVRERLRNHLNSCATSLEQIGSMTNFNNGYRCGPSFFNEAFLKETSFPMANATAKTAKITTPTAIIPPLLVHDMNNNQGNQGTALPVPPIATVPSLAAPIEMGGGVQLIPSRLPSGELALIMPNTNGVQPSTANTTTSATNLLNNNVIANSPFAAWPYSMNNSAAIKNVVAVEPSLQLAGANMAQTNDFTANFKRISAFSKPQIQQHPSPLQTPPIVQQQPATLEPQKYMKTTMTTTTTTNSNNKTAQQRNNQLTKYNNLHHHNSAAPTSPPLSPISSISSHGDDSSMMHTSSDFVGGSRPATPPQDFHNSTAHQHSFSGVFATPPSTETSASSGISINSSINLQQQQVSSTSGCESSLSLKRSFSDVSDDVSDESCDEPSVKTEKRKKMMHPKEEIKTNATTVDGERDNMWRPW